MDRMFRIGFLLALLALWGCKSKPESTAVVKAGSAKDAPELDSDKGSQLARATERNVDQYYELLRQGRTQQSVALRQVVARAVDDDWATFAAVANDEKRSIVRNMSVKCISFASAKRVEARELLLGICANKPPKPPWLLANAVLGIGNLLDRETDLTPVISLCGHGDVEVRTNAATALLHLFRVKATPRELTPQYHAAIDRLVTILHDRTSVRGRRAAAWALANLHHPALLDHLISALLDDDEQVQVGGLRGIEQLGDQRALEPLLAYLRKGPTPEGASWAQKALVSIAVQGGFTDKAAELEELGANPKLWEKWFTARRSR